MDLTNLFLNSFPLTYYLKINIIRKLLVPSLIFLCLSAQNLNNSPTKRIRSKSATIAVCEYLKGRCNMSSAATCRRLTSIRLWCSLVHSKPRKPTIPIMHGTRTINLCFHYMKLAQSWFFDDCFSSCGLWKWRNWQRKKYYSRATSASCLITFRMWIWENLLSYWMLNVKLDMN